MLLLPSIQLRRDILLPVSLSFVRQCYLQCGSSPVSVVWEADLPFQCTLISESVVPLAPTAETYLRNEFVNVVVKREMYWTRTSP